MSSLQEIQAHQDKKEAIYQQEKNLPLTFWEKLDKMCHADMATMYYDLVEDHNFIFFDDEWFKYNENNIITSMGKKNPIHLKKHITVVLQTYFETEYKKLSCEGAKEKHKLYKASHKLVGTSGYLDGIIDLLKTEYYDDKVIEKMDANPNLIAFNNTLFDYEIKQFRAIKKTDYISFTCGYEITPKSNKVNRIFINNLLHSIFEDKDLIDYWLRTVSCALFTNKFESLYVHTGKGGNGKGVLFNLLENATGDYFMTAGNTFLTTSFKAGQANPTLASSKGKRFLLVSEPETEGDKYNSNKLNVDFVKSITGGDTITARQLYKSEVSFKPLFTTFLQCNAQPELGKLDDGIKRRVKVMEYPFTFKETPNPSILTQKAIDTSLKSKLKNFAYIQEFMLLLIETAVQFDYENKKCIPKPAQVEEESNKFIDNNDPVKDWLFENYNITYNKKDVVSSAEIYDEYKKVNNKIDQKKFNQYMLLHELKSERSTGGKAVFKGLLKKVVEIPSTPISKNDFMSDSDDEEEKCRCGYEKDLLTKENKRLHNKKCPIHNKNL